MLMLPLDAFSCRDEKFGSGLKEPDDDCQAAWLYAQQSNSRHPLYIPRCLSPAHVFFLL